MSDWGSRIGRQVDKWCGRGRDGPAAATAAATADRFSCWIDLMCMLNNMCFAFLWMLVLLYTSGVVRKAEGIRRRHGGPVVRYAQHHVRWLAALTLCLVHWVDVADVLVANALFVNDVTSSARRMQPLFSFYLPLCSFVVVVVCCFYYDRIEVKGLL